MSSSGEICVNTLKKDWVPTYGIGHILITVKCLLIYPNPESALDEEAGKLLLEDYESYCDRARLITSVHATPKVKPKEFETPPQTQAEAGEGSSKSNTLAVALPTSSAERILPILTVVRRSSSPQPQSQPLQSSASNTMTLLQTNIKEKEKERHTSPAPLSTADANVGTMKPLNAVLSVGNKAVKRSATGVPGNGAEKRKKALKRL